MTRSGALHQLVNFCDTVHTFGRSGFLNCSVEFKALGPLTQVPDAMNEICDQNKEEPLTYEIPDEVLETAASTEQWEISPSGYV